MIYLEDLVVAKKANLDKIAELEAENRVFDKLIAMEESKVANEPAETENVQTYENV